MWDFFQEMRLNDVSQQSKDNKSHVRENQGEIFDQSMMLKKMAMVNQALYEILKERVGITDEELRRKIREIDLRDGVENGSVSVPPLKCPQCEGRVTAGALNCQSCGAMVAPEYPFKP